MRSRDVAVSQNHFIFLLGPTVWVCEAFVRGVKSLYKQPLVICSPDVSVSATGAGKSLIAMTTAAHTDTATGFSGLCVSQSLKDRLQQQKLHLKQNTHIINPYSAKMGSLAPHRCTKLATAARRNVVSRSNQNWSVRPTNNTLTPMT